MEALRINFVKVMYLVASPGSKAKKDFCVFFDRFLRPIKIQLRKVVLEENKLPKAIELRVPI